MSLPIGHGPGNLNGASVHRRYLANGTITKGEAVGFLVGTSNTGYTIDQANRGTIAPIGVALETGTDVWIDVCIGGYCSYVTNDGTDVVAGDYLVSTTAGVAIPLTSAEIALTDIPHIYGQSLGAETGTTCTQCVIYQRVP